MTPQQHIIEGSKCQWRTHESETWREGRMEKFGIDDGGYVTGYHVRYEGEIVVIPWRQFSKLIKIS